MGKYFGTDGFRGEVNVTLTATHAYAIGLILGVLAEEYEAAFERDAAESDRVAAGRGTAEGRIAAGRGTADGLPAILIGMDTRRSGEMFAHALAAGITASGADAHLVGVVTTPALAYLTRMGNFAFGVMISASHNPYTDNGIKIFNSGGEKLPDETTDRIEAFLDRGTDALGSGAFGAVGAPFATGKRVGTVRRCAFLRDNYVEYLADIAVHGAGFFTEDAHKPFAGMRIALDCANGSASGIAPTLFTALGAKVVACGNKPDGLNINKDCGSTHIAGLQKLVVEEGCDLGFAFDGDADRCLAVDAAGNVVDGDGIMYICGQYLAGQERLAGRTVVTTVMSNFGLYKAFDEAGIAYEKTAVGDRFVYQNMCDNGFSLGGEQSGHVIFRELATTGDGLVTALMTLEALCSDGRTLAEAAAGYTAYPQVLKNVRVPDRTVAMNDTGVQAAVKKAQDALNESGRVLVRPSGTEPLIRVMAEASDAADAEAQVDAIINAMYDAGVAVRQ